MTRSVIALHGSFGHPYENWLPALHAACLDAGIKCYVPQLPTPEGQSFDTWSSIVTPYLEVIGEDASQANVVLVAHSSAAPFAVRLLASKSMKLASLVTVAGFSEFTSGLDDFDRVNAAVDATEMDCAWVLNNVVSSSAFMSDNDPYLPAGELEKFADAIGAKTHLIEGAGHFNADAGFVDFPPLIELVLRLASE